MCAEEVRRAQEPSPIHLLHLMYFRCLLNLVPLNQAGVGNGRWAASTLQRDWRARLRIFIHFLGLYLNKLLAVVKSTASIYLYTQRTGFINQGKVLLSGLRRHASGLTLPTEAFPGVPAVGSSRGLGCAIGSSWALPGKPSREKNLLRRSKELVKSSCTHLSLIGSWSLGK